MVATDNHWTLPNVLNVLTVRGHVNVYYYWNEFDNEELLFRASCSVSMGNRLEIITETENVTDRGTECR